MSYFNKREPHQIVQSIFACELRAKTVPPVADRFIAYTYSTLMKQVFHIAQREWKSHIQHHRKLDDLRAGFEITEGKLIGNGWETNCQTS